MTKGQKKQVRSVSARSDDRTFDCDCRDKSAYINPLESQLFRLTFCCSVSK